MHLFIFDYVFSKYDTYLIDLAGSKSGPCQPTCQLFCETSGAHEVADLWVSGGHIVIPSLSGTLFKEMFFYHNKCIWMHYALHQDKNIFSIQLKGQLLLFMLLFPWETQGTVNTLLTRLAQMRQWYHAWAGSSASCTLSVKWKTLIGIRTLSISKRHSHLFSGSALVPSPRGYLFSSPWLRFLLTHPPFLSYLPTATLHTPHSLQSPLEAVANNLKGDHRLVDLERSSDTI